MIKIYFDLREEEKFIRETVFVIEQGFKEEFDELDSLSTHFVYYQNDNKAVGCLRILFNKEKQIYQIGRVAILKEYRRKGIGKSLMLEAESYLRNMNVKRVYVSSQKRAEPFYTKIGYMKTGDYYLDENYPHLLMYKEL